MQMRRKYKRVGFTAAQKSELWDRWQRGEGLKSIGRAFGKSSSSIYVMCHRMAVFDQRLDVVLGGH